MISVSFRFYHAFYRYFEGNFKSTFVHKKFTILGPFIVVYDFALYYFQYLFDDDVKGRDEKLVADQSQRVKHVDNSDNVKNDSTML